MRSSVVKNLLRTAGEDFDVSRGDEIFTARGARNRDGTGAKCLTFEPDAHVRSGDTLYGRKTQERFYVRDIQSTIVEGEVLAIQAYYETEREHAERLAQAAPQPQYVGAYIQTMQGGNVQAIGYALQSKISQLVNDPQALAEALDRILTQLLDVVKSELPASQLVTYIQQAEELKATLKSDHPQPMVVKRLLGTLAFLGDVEGSVGLISRVWPLIGSLMPIAMTVLQQAQLR